MREVLRQIVPSMFHRRLLLLGAVVLGLMGLLGVQTARLTTGQQHATRRATVEKALEKPRLTPTVRGAIYDRKGRLLAEDKPGWDIEVSYGVLSGDWAFGQGVEAARRDLGRQAWAALLPAQREAVVAQGYVEPYRLQIEMLWVTLAELGGVDPGQVYNRRDQVNRWVQMLTANASFKKRDNQMMALRENREAVTWAESYVQVAEEAQSHAMLFDVNAQVVARVEYFIARARQEQEQYEGAVKRAAAARQPPPPDEREYQVWLEVQPQHVKQRRYPWETRTFSALDRSTFPGPLRSDKPIQITVDGIGRHILGTLRRIHREDPPWNQRPYSRKDEDGQTVIDLAGYRPNDPIGRFGIERSMEGVLRGSRGTRVLHLDTGQEEITRPIPGGEVHLTIDIVLQARLQALMSHDPRVGLMLSQPWHGAGDRPMAPKPGEKLNGAAVVMDIDNGEILAAVSVPGLSIHELETNDIGIYGDHINMPYLFRPVGYRYEPGSTNKTLVLAAAITDGIIAPDQVLDCSLGHLWPGKPNFYRDWIYKASNGNQNFGRIDGVEALKVSSNVFFGKLALMFGEQSSYERLVWWFSEMGFGRRAGCGLFEEVAGFLPSPDRKVSEEEAAYLAIGEGAMGVSPMQVVAAHATLARGGLYIPPTFVQDRSRPGPPRQPRQLHLSPAAHDRALRGMDASANDPRGGTTHHITYSDGTREPNFTVPGVKVLAKSGTAEPMAFRRPNADGTPNPTSPVVREGNHAWVVAFVQPEGYDRPTHAIAVVVEFAGSGGRVAGPIVNQIVKALAEENYLGDTVHNLVVPQEAHPVTAGASGGHP